MTGKKKIKYKTDYHYMEVHRVRFWLKQHWTADEICIAMRKPYATVLRLIREAQLLDGTYDLV